jgi:aryl sulfotransferase
MTEVLPAAREYQTVVMDSRRWSEFRFREGDIMIGTWAKSGTTWMQQIISQLVFNGAEGLLAIDIAPWLATGARSPGAGTTI